MKFFKGTSLYFVKNFFVVMLFVLPASLFYAFLIRPTGFVFIKGYRSMEIDRFTDVFMNIFNFHWTNILYSVAFIAILVFTFILLTGLIEYHMRTGRMRLSRAFHQMTKYIAPTVIVFAVLIAAFFFLTFVFAAFVYFAHTTTGNLGTVGNATSFSMVLVAYVFLISLFVAFASFMLTSILLSVVQTNSFRGSLTACAYLYDGGNFLAHFGTMAIAAVIFFAPLYFVGSFLLVELVIATFTALALGYAIVNNIAAFFKLNNMERKDDIKSFFK